MFSYSFVATKAHTGLLHERNTAMSQSIVYYVQCITGKPHHVKGVIVGTELHGVCEERANSGKLDAYCLGPEDCVECVEERRDQARQNEQLDCAIGGLEGCDPDCPCRTPVVIADSRFEDQVTWVPVAA